MGRREVNKMAHAEIDRETKTRFSRNTEEYSQMTQENETKAAEMTDEDVEKKLSTPAPDEAQPSSDEPEDEAVVKGEFTEEVGLITPVVALLKLGKLPEALVENSFTTLKGLLSDLDSLVGDSWAEEMGVAVEAVKGGDGVEAVEAKEAGSIRAALEAEELLTKGAGIRLIPTVIGETGAKEILEKVLRASAAVIKCQAGDHALVCKECGAPQAKKNAEAPPAIDHDASALATLWLTEKKLLPTGFLVFLGTGLTNLFGTAHKGTSGISRVGGGRTSFPPEGSTGFTQKIPSNGGMEYPWRIHTEAGTGRLVVAVEAGELQAKGGGKLAEKRFTSFSPAGVALKMALNTNLTRAGASTRGPVFFQLSKSHPELVA